MFCSLLLTAGGTYRREESRGSLISHWCVCSTTGGRIFRRFRSRFFRRVERQFLRTYRESDVAICVSDQMRAELGERTNSFVIHPVPSFTAAQHWTPNFKLPLRVVYFGNLCEYGPLIENALRALNGSDRVRLEVFGPTRFGHSGRRITFGPGTFITDSLRRINSWKHFNTSKPS